jgi:hypothetical protein
LGKKAKRAKKLFAFLARFALLATVYYLFIRTPPKKTRIDPIRLSFAEAVGFKALPAAVCASA